MILKRGSYSPRLDSLTPEASGNNLVLGIMTTRLISLLRWTSPIASITDLICWTRMRIVVYKSILR